jgi:phosphoribosylglycinamide formyltransferase-1
VTRYRLVILISGRGSNMEALLNAQLPASIEAVISNVPQARGLDIARSRGVFTSVVDHRSFASRDAFDDELSAAIDRHAPDLVVLAGFMRVLGARFVQRYEGRLLNIHPSLLPAFPGLHTHRRALAAGVRVHGCTVHFVTTTLDHGPIVAQAAVPVMPDDTEELLATRVLRQEHVLYPRAVRWFCEGRLKLTREGNVTVEGANAPSVALISPTVDPS